MGKFIDLTDKTFGKLLVCGLAGKNRFKQLIWKCQCKCGNIVIVVGGNLVNGTSKSCGQCSTNEFQIVDDYVIGFTSKDEPFYFDIDDYERVKVYSWHINDKGYVVSDESRKRIKLHRLVMDAADNEEVDHRDHKLDNCRKYNLRLCTRSQNMWNLRKQNRKTSSRFKGVSWDKSKGKWRSEINVNNKRIYLGLYSNEIDGALAYNRAAVKYFKEFACLNNVDAKAS